ncbi:Protein-lysine N-methyltransferase efm5 [Coemansia sp. RSA 990]|nr:putative N6-adenine methyltransferase-domain-containing protein [Coemansia mojavensis]KAJ1753338.1 Protein-lysine N-methyltransferase efm5 [Coemansia sp. RSA 1821]KAJ1875702.1 Protein-lysine N-methyltransferase efm5 [Coemansia sp. RSA 990]KAJ2650691.1 Protein-lysine N-methyltransferase efm5 [Coemansia sp. RSA 1250]
MDSEETPALSADTLAILQSFLSEKQEQDERFAKLQENADEVFKNNQKIDMSVFQEDWQLSQFWYDDKTAEFLADRVYENTESNDHVAFISSPTAFVAFRNKYDRENAFVFEFDERFDIFKHQFVHYDFNKPLEFARAQSFEHKFKFIIADPPFLNKDCLSQTLETVKFLAAPDAKIMIDTGAVMKDLARELIGARITNFNPAHKGGLSNEFRCYSTFEDDQLTWITE